MTEMSDFEIAERTMTEMSALEAAMQTQECLYWMVHSGRIFSGHDPVKMHAYWNARVRELKAAEKEAEAQPEPEHDPTLFEQVARLQSIVNTMLAVQRTFRKQFDDHHHHMPVAGRCYY